jgi:hypothetical protein
MHNNPRSPATRPVNQQQQQQHQINSAPSTLVSRRVQRYVILLHRIFYIQNVFVEQIVKKITEDHH